MRRMTVWLALLVVLGLTAVPAHGQTFGQNLVQYRRRPWRVVDSEHFRVCFASGLDSLALRVLDLAEQTDVMLARRLGYSPSRRVPILLYGSGNDLAQSNLVPGVIGTDPGGFIGRLQTPALLRFTGSYEELRHDAVRELANAYLSDMLHGGSAPRRLFRQAFCSPPPWFDEGLAEYLAPGVEPDAVMILRDGIIEGTLPPLEHSGDRLARLLGQSAIAGLVERHGEQRLRELLLQVRQSPGFARAFRRVMGLPVRTFGEQWREWLRQEYWPAAATRRDPERLAQRLTDHRRDGGRLNAAPAISPQGDRIAWFSDRRRTTDVYRMSAFDGKELRRIFRGERRDPFEASPVFRNSIAWSPDGARLALTVSSGGQDVLCIVSALDGRVLKRIGLECDALAYPAWSPVAESLVVVGLKDGRSDLWLVDAGTGGARRLTADVSDEKEPCWAPDGRTVTFASDRLLPVVLRPEQSPGSFGCYGLFDLDLESGAITRRAESAGAGHSPAWSPDGRKLAFVSDRGGASDILLYETGSRGLTRLTNVRGGVASLSWSRRDDRLVFSAFDRGGHDVFVLREPVSVDAVLDRLKREMPQNVMSGVVAPQGATECDTAPGRATRTPRIGGGESFAPPDSVVARPPLRCPGRLSPDHVRGGLMAVTGFGVVGSAALSLSDLPGDQRLTLGADVFCGPLEETNALLLYSYLPRRWDFSAGLFHFKNSESAPATGTGTGLGGAPFLAERSLGMLLVASRPFDRFRRLDFAFAQGFVESESWEEAGRAEAAGGGRRYQPVSVPSFALVSDHALWGSTGPVSGGRSNLTVRRSSGEHAPGLSRGTVTLDARRYWSPNRGYTFAVRVLAGRSDGRSARTFLAGGSSTLRGFPHRDLRGTRLAIVNAELRFPFIERFGTVGPLPFGRTGLRGALFADAGLVWDRGEPLRLTQRVRGRRVLASPVASLGTGVRSRLGFMVVKLDAAWPTDLASVGRPRWEFSIAPEF